MGNTNICYSFGLVIVIKSGDKKAAVVQIVLNETDFIAFYPLIFHRLNEMVINLFSLCILLCITKWSNIELG